MPDERELWEQYRQSPEAQRPATPCPDAQALAAFAEHRFSGSHLDELEAHLAQCAACRGAVRIAQAVLAETAPPIMSAPTRPQTRWYAWPLRAAVVLAVASLLALAYSAGSRMALVVSGAAGNSTEDTFGSEF